MKTCSKCKEVKHENSFYHNKSTKDGLSYWCSDCVGIKQKIRNREMPIPKLDSKNETKRERYKTDPIYRKRNILATNISKNKVACRKFDVTTSLLDELSQDAEFRDLLINMGK